MKIKLDNKLLVQIAWDETLDSYRKITDGYGGRWSITCPECGKDTMHVVRPGKVQCGECG